MGEPWKEYQGKPQGQSSEVAEQDRLRAVAAWAYQHFPFLDSESPYANSAAINEVIVIRDREILAGVPASEALARAAEQVGSRYEAMESRQRMEFLLRERERLNDVIKQSENERRRAAMVQRQARPRTPSGINKPDDIIIDTRSGQRMDNAAGGFVDPRTGTFYQKVAGGYVETTTGRFIPSP
ncbi:hypothetical protein ACP3P8_25560 [Pseudomonas aeruginosa]